MPSVSSLHNLTGEEWRAVRDYYELTDDNEVKTTLRTIAVNAVTDAVQDAVLEMAMQPKSPTTGGPRPV